MRPTKAISRRWREFRIVLGANRVRIHEFLNYYDLSYSNPTDRPLELHLRLMAPGHGTDAESIRIEVPVRGTTVVSRPNETGAVAAFESLSRASLWRPVVFKHYQSHFDVFHG